MATVQDHMLKHGVKQQTINGKSYSLTHLPASVGFVTFLQLVELFGTSTASIIDNSAREDFVLPEENYLFTQATQLLIEKIAQKEEVLNMVMKLTSTVSCDGKAVDFDTHFAGNYGELVLIVEWVLKENFKDAFTCWLKAKGLSIPTLGKVMEMVKSLNQSSQESTEKPS